MTGKRKESVRKATLYAFLIVLGVFMIYPLLWLFTASFKSNREIFGSLSLWPSNFDFSSYIEGWNSTGRFSFSTFFVNTFKLVIPTVLFTIISSTLVAYGFARFKFPFKKFLFSLMISTLMLPSAVTIIPSYILFRSFGWLDSYKPFYIPALLGGSAFFIFMMIQFLRGLPRELDESAIIDGCNSFTILLRILIPLAKPAIFSVGIFQFMWTWNDFYGQLIYINSARKFTIALGLRMTQDVATIVSWNQVIAMSVVSIIPSVLLYFFAQKYFVEGIATTGIKG